MSAKQIARTINTRFERLDTWNKERARLWVFGLLSSGGVAIAYAAGVPNALEMVALPAAIAGFDLGHIGADFTRNILRSIFRFD